MEPLSAGVAIAVALTPLAHNLLKRTLGPLADEIGEHWAEKLHGYFERNRTKTINRAAEMVRESGKEAKPLPTRVVLAVAAGAAKEDQPELQEMWAALLANAAIAGDPELVPASYAAILERMSPYAVFVLDKLAESPSEWDVWTLASHIAMPISSVDMGKLQASLDTLVSLGLAQRKSVYRGGISWDDIGTIETAGENVHITTLGKRFHTACTAPKRD